MQGATDVNSKHTCHNGMELGQHWANVIIIKFMAVHICPAEACSLFLYPMLNEVEGG